MENNQPLLSICIPIYNRVEYLEKMLRRFLEDRELFDGKIDLLISDNCSTDDVKSCVDRFKMSGIKLSYNRNQKNLGPDGNFLYCFNHVSGKYCWLLGSDDIPVSGFLRSLIGILENNDYGLFHLDCYSGKKNQVEDYSDNQQFLKDINFWITYMSSNIIKASYIYQVNGYNYLGTNLIQVPYYLTSCLNEKKNGIYFGDCFEQDNDSINNGSFNFFKVFVENLFNIYGEFQKAGLLTEKTIDSIKKYQFEHFVFSRIVLCLILKKNKNYLTDGAWSIIWKHYGKKIYFYLFPLKKTVQIVVCKIKRSFNC